jgi:zinc protease
MRHLYLLNFAIVFCCLFVSSLSVALNIQEVRSPSGITAWLAESHNVPVISMSFRFRAGATSDHPGKEGTANFLSAMLDEGAGELNSQVFQEKLVDLSIEMGFDAGLEHFSGSLRTLTKNSDEAFRLLQLALTQARFDREAIERVRAQMIGSLKSRLKRPSTIASREWYKMFFGTHPYGRPITGTIKTVSGIKSEDLKDFVKNNLGQSNLVIGVAGDISPEKLSLKLDEIFSRLPRVAILRELPKPHRMDTPGTVLIEREFPQSVVVFGHRGLKRDDPDWYAAYVLNNILGGGGFSSRLMEQIRETRGLAYGVYTWLDPMERTGLIMGEVATDNSRVSESLKIIESEWRKMSQTGVSETELESAKAYINGAFPLTLDSTRRISKVLASVQFDRLGINYLSQRPKLINRVTTEDIRRVARRLLKAGALRFLVVGKPKSLRSVNDLIKRFPD